MQQSDPPIEIVVVPVHLDSLGRRVGEVRELLSKFILEVIKVMNFTMAFTMVLPSTSTCQALF